MLHLINAVVLAAGKSNRFKGQSSKLMTKICGQEMILYPLKLLSRLKLCTTLVVRDLEKELKTLVKDENLGAINFVRQEKVLGTGHAVACTKKLWDNPYVLVLNGDTPLIPDDLIKELIESHQEKNAAVSIVTAFVLSPTGYGRIVEDENGICIVEEKDCGDSERHINKINAGIYLFSRQFLKEHIDLLKDKNAASEFYLTDMIKIASGKGFPVNVVSRSYDEVRGINNLEELWAVEQIKRSDSMRKLMHNGVRFELAQTIHVDNDVQIENGSFIGSGTHLYGNTKIGKNCHISACCILENATVGNNTILHPHTIIKNSKVGVECQVGPFAHIHDNSSVCANTKIGSFTEVSHDNVCPNKETTRPTITPATVCGSKVDCLEHRPSSLNKIAQK